MGVHTKASPGITDALAHSERPYLFANLGSATHSRAKTLQPRR